MKVPVLPVAGFQWILATFILCAQSRGFDLFVLLSPAWLFAISYLVLWHITVDPILAPAFSIVFGGLVGASIEQALLQTGNKLGLVFGMFFSALLTLHRMRPEKPMSLIWAIGSTILLLVCLDVFEYLSFFLYPPPDTFSRTVTVILSTAIFVVMFKYELSLLRRIRMAKHRSRATKRKP